MHETYGLSGESLQAWYRARGPFAHHLTSWKVIFCADGKEPTSSRRELHTSKDEIVMLKRVALRKDKPLAATAPYAAKCSKIAEKMAEKHQAHRKGGLGA